jgi:Alpha/beta hydrolase domain
MSTTERAASVRSLGAASGHLTPLTGGSKPFIYATSFDLAAAGYIEAGYTLAGSAHAYARTRHGVTAAEQADYATRVLIYRPADDDAFNGTVWVEWLNVSGGIDVAAAWTSVHTELIRCGAAWVGVSAQRIGVSGDVSVLGMTGTGLADLDPVRYGTLCHPGDRFSYDIYPQASAAARSGTGTILAGLPIARVLAMGESQSAFRLTTFANDVGPITPVHDGFLVRARPAAAAPLDEHGDPAGFRADLRVPVLCVESETDLIALGYLAARQEDSRSLVTWEIAGTSHADMYTLSAGPIDSGLLSVEELARAWVPAREIMGMHFDQPVNAGPRHYVLNAAASHLDRWARDGTRPPAGQRLATRAGALSPDGHGNARGGIRTPHVDVPIAVLSGLGNGGDPISFLCGSTAAFDAEKLAGLYPSRSEYLKRFEAATTAAVAAGFLLAEDVSEITAIAAVNFPC